MSIFHLLHYGFIQKAFLAGSFIAVLCSTLGVFLVLRRMSLIGDGLSHVSFGAIALGLFFGVYPVYLAVPLVVAGSLLIIKITEKAKVYGDAAIGIVSAVGIASGVILASLSQGFNTDLFSYLFGNILAISGAEVILSVALSIAVFCVIYFFYHDLFSVTFDEEYARTTGIKAGTMNSLLAMLTAITVVLSVKVVGVMLVSALLILPAAAALQVAKSFRAAIMIGGVTALLSVLSGIVVSFYLNLPAGATIVMVNVGFFLLGLVLRKLN
jgi:zinc transport system permease protein